MPIAPGAVVASRYAVLEPLGKGGEGSVFLAEDRGSGRRVALKVLGSADPRGIDRLRHEFTLLSGLRHPNLATVLDFGFVDDGAPFLATEYIPGHDLKTASALAEPDQPAEWVHQILRGLHHIHAKGVLHGDLKPSNILVGTDNVVRLVDFGLAFRADERRERDYRGTLPYMAPERLRHGAYDLRSDFFSLGVTLYESLTGQLPFAADSPAALSRAHQGQDPPPLPEVVPETLRRVVARLLDRDPARRPSSANELLEALGAPLEPAALASTHFLLGAFVGREDELGRLLQLLDRPGATFVLAGPSGIGKTRLFQEFRNLSLVQGVRVLASEEAPSAVPLSAWRALLRAAGMPPDPEASETGLRAVVAALEAFAARHPTVLFVDDLDLCDEASVDLFVRLAWRGSVRLGAAMSDRALRARLPEEIEWVDLGPLAPGDVETLARSYLPLGPLPDPVRAALTSHGAGFPLFVEEVLRTLARTGALRPAGARWEFDPAGISGAPLGDGWEPWFERTWARLSGPARAAAGALRLAGRSMAGDLLAELVAGDNPWAAIAEGESAGVLRRDGDRIRLLGPVARFIARRPADPALARALAERFERDGAHPGETASLWEAAGDAARAFECSVSAADAAARLGWRGLEAAHLERCVRLRPSPDLRERWGAALARVDVDRAHAVLSEAARERPTAEASFWLGQVAFHRGDVEDSISHLRRAAELWSRPEDLARRLTAWNKLVESLVHAGRRAEALAMAPEVDPHTSAADPAVRHRAHRILGYLAHQRGEIEACRRHNEAALAAAREMGEVEAIAQAWNQVGVAHDYPRAAEAMAEAARVAGEAGLVRTRALALSNLGATLRDLGRFDEAKKTLREAMGLARASGDLKRYHQGGRQLALLEIAAGEYGPARKRLEEGLACFEAGGDRRMVAYLKRHLAWLEAEEGRYERSSALLDEAEALAGSSIEPELRRDILEVRGWIALRRRDAAALEGAASALDAAGDPAAAAYAAILRASPGAVDRAEKTGQPLIVFAAIERLAWAAHETGKLQETERLAARLRSVASERGIPGWSARATILEGAVQISSGEAGVAATILADIRAAIPADLAWRRDHLLAIAHRRCGRFDEAAVAALHAAQRLRTLVRDPDPDEFDVIEEATAHPVSEPPERLLRCLVAMAQATGEGDLLELLAGHAVDLLDAEAALARTDAGREAVFGRPTTEWTLRVPITSAGRGVGELLLSTPFAFEARQRLIAEVLAAQAGAILGRWVTLMPGMVDDPEIEEVLRHPQASVALAMLARVLEVASPERMIEMALDVLLMLTPAERGFLVARDDRDRMVCLGSRKITDTDAFLSTTYVARAMKEGGAILISEVEKNDEARRQQSVVEQGVTSILVVPLPAEPRAVGVLYLDTCSPADRITDLDRLLAEHFAKRITAALVRARTFEKLQRETVALRGLVETRLQVEKPRYDYSQIVGKSHAIRKVLMLVDRAVESSYPVLIEGESGTGKELVARAIHFNGPRAAKPFLAVNCAAMAETLLESELFGHARGAFTGAERDRVGVFEMAHEGTLFLDEVGEMAPAMQSKFLRVLEDGEVRPIGAKTARRVDVRVVAATNRNLAELAEQGGFRKDLFYRLAVLKVRVPPLRERPEDIPLLAERFLAESAEERGEPPPRLKPGVVRELMRHDWPGNVRELQNMVKRLSITGEKEIDTAMLRQLTRIRRKSADLMPQPVRPLRQVEEEAARRAIEEALRKTGGSRSKAAQLLGIPERTLYYRMKKLGLGKK